VKRKQAPQHAIQGVELWSSGAQLCNWHVGTSREGLYRLAWLASAYHGSLVKASRYARTSCFDPTWV
jgi:hypothetical protein